MVQTTPDVEDRTLIHKQSVRNYQLPQADIGETLARVRLHEVLGRHHDNNIFPLVGTGAQSFVFQVTPSVVGKVDKQQSDDHERLSRLHYQQNCEFFFGDERVVHSHYPPQNGIVQAVHFQKDISRIINHPDTLNIASGYEDEQMHDPRTYAAVNERAIFQRGPFDPDAFKAIFRNKDMQKTFTLMKIEALLRERLVQLFSQMSFFAQKTKQPVDCMAYKNLFVYPEADEWQFKMSDPQLLLDHKKLMRTGQELLEYFSKGGDAWNDDMLVHLINYINFVRFVNGFADLLGLDPEEHITVPSMEVHWEKLQWLLYNFIQRRKGEKKSTDSSVSSQAATIIRQNDLAA